MRVVEKATDPPGKCLVSADIDGPFLDTETWTNQTDAHIYLHVPVVEAMGREVGMVPKAEVEALRVRVEEMGFEIEKMRRQITAYDSLRNVITEDTELEPVA